MNSMFSSTIAAVSTPRGRGGIAVIRISGDDAISVADKFVRGRVPLADAKARRANMYKIVDGEESVLDEALVTVFRAPNSYTGEDTVEISCHGSDVLCAEILELAFSFGAVPAGPGEFTRRAFSAGKLTLTEAESVIELIDAKSRAALALSRKNLDGALSDETDAIYKKLRAALGSVYAGIDFPDEDLETLDDSGMAQEITDAISMLSRLSSSYKTGHAVIEGVPTVICGKPNVGKSTMLNTLLMRERAIVTDIPGTTRDVVSETAVIGDVLLSIRDTAGIRESGDEIERIGILKSVGQIEECELVIGMFDASRPCDGDDERVISLLCDAKESGRDVIAVLNKCDLPQKFDEARLSSLGGAVHIVASDKSSRDVISKKIGEIFFAGGASSLDGAIVTNARQHASVTRSLNLCKSALIALKTLGADIAGSEIERAMAELSEMDGRQVGIDVVNEIFGKFCVGK